MVVYDASPNMQVHLSLTFIWSLQHQDAGSIDEHYDDWTPNTPCLLKISPIPPMTDASVPMTSIKLFTNWPTFLTVEGEPFFFSVSSGLLERLPEPTLLILACFLSLIIPLNFSSCPRRGLVRQNLFPDKPGLSISTEKLKVNDKLFPVPKTHRISICKILYPAAQLTQLYWKFRGDKWIEQQGTEFISSNSSPKILFTQKLTISSQSKKFSISQTIFAEMYVSSLKSILRKLLHAIFFLHEIQFHTSTLLPSGKEPLHLSTT